MDAAMVNDLPVDELAKLLTSAVDEMVRRMATAEKRLSGAVNEVNLKPLRAAEDRATTMDLLKLPTPGVSAGQLSGSVRLLKGGYGFITPSEEGPNIFFYFAEVHNATFATLKVGDRVTYSIGDGPKGPCAKNIVVIK